jgi:hypothetical protein
MGGSFGKSTYKVINFPLQPLSKLTKSNWSIPLSGWVTGQKSFNESLKSDGNPIEQKINRGILKAIGVSNKPSEGYYNPYNSEAMQGMMQNNTSNEMMSNMVNQIATANQAFVKQKEDALASQNASQQSNIAANVAQAGTQALGFRAPVETKFTSANTFSSPNLNGLTFSGK